MRVVLPNNFTPRAYQRKAFAFFDAGGKRAITVWPRRAGKDLGALHYTCCAAHRRIGDYWHFFPSLAQGRKMIWDGHTSSGERVMEQVFPGFLNPSGPNSIVKAKNETEMSVELKCGSTWRMMGADHSDNVGGGPVGIVLSEFALYKPGLWSLLRPMLRESGGWLWIITTPRGENEAWDVFQVATAENGWYRDHKTVSDLGLTYHSTRGDKLISAAEMVEEERAEGMPDEMIEQEYFCSWTASNVGAVFGKQIVELQQRGGIGEFSHPTNHVSTSWDIGHSDATGIWFWRHRGAGVEVLDHYENNNQDLEHYLQVLREKSVERGFTYLKHYLPHDARAKTFLTGVSVIEAFGDAVGRDKVEITPMLDKKDGINAARMLLKHPETRIHSRCGLGLKALKHYHYEWNSERKTFAKEPKHDWSSHSADAFRYLAVVVNPAKLFEPRKEPVAEPFARPAGYGTMDDAWKWRRS